MTDSTKLNDTLELGETVLWTGVSQPYSLFGESYKKSTLISLGWAAGWAILLVGGYIALAIYQGSEIQTGVMIFCAAVPVFIVYMVISDKNKVKKLEYAITDKRAIVLSDKQIAMPLADIDAIRVDKADDGNCHVRVGSAAFKASVRKLPLLAFRSQSGGQDSDPVKGLVFFNVSGEDEKKICSLLKPGGSPAEA